ncbi:hypothetical protein BDV38DRAFT_232855 [Aspergillus pseudotamarii]|uniref:Uncharacterized protein n=1 Tax=Aspergillus pseudotamarii TaxID=132259 RepID=A0A5N6TA19_ASPPS|nr:uncharacterized protein BDV38DRAFT_232855 [Aspergillus pseudotamarii]KAE8143152.1 hypothetical protein BDV38DRAFT_232855 [Aspergillus pseudotamarii]
MNDDMEEDEDDDTDNNTDSNAEEVASLSCPMIIDLATEKEKNLTTNVPADHLPLKDHIEKVSSLTLDETIQAISDLISGLAVAVASNGEYLLAHDKHEGTVGLDRLCEVYDNCATRWLDEHTTLQTHSLQGSLDTLVLSLYRFGDLVLNAGRTLNEAMEPPDDCGHQSATQVRVLNEEV